MRNRESGFTLIEVLVASAITALIGVMAYGFLNAAIDAQQAQQRQTEQLNEINLFFTVLARDLRQAVERPVYDAFGQPEAALLGGEDAEYLLALTRTGWSNPRWQARSEFQRVAYEINEESIERKAWYTLDRIDDETFEKAVVLQNVEEVSFRFLDEANVTVRSSGVGKKWEKSWGESNPGSALGATGRNVMPVAVEIVLRHRQFGEVRRLFDLPGLG